LGLSGVKTAKPHCFLETDMELIDVIARVHFENPKTGSVSRKQRLRIGKPLADYLAELGLVDFLNPPQAVVREYPKTEPESLGGDEPSTLLQPAQALPEATATVFRRGRRKKNSE
jgi:hypothetical protein